MITLFISNGELISALILFFLLGLYGLSKHGLYRSRELGARIRKMSDEELEDNLKVLNEAFISKGRYWTGVEIHSVFDEKSRRGWLKSMSSEELTSRFQHLLQLVKPLSFREGFTSRQELAFIKKEMKKRRLL